jgi:hypothetical protein
MFKTDRQLPNRALERIDIVDPNPTCAKIEMLLPQRVFVRVDKELPKAALQKIDMDSPPVIDPRRLKLLPRIK